MRIVFDPDFDSGAWPGTLTDRDASAGEAWVGTAGFLDHLEARLGLGGPRASPVERIAALLTPVRQVPGFWSRSGEADVIETAAALLRWRDLLWTAGWRGQPIAQRLAELATVTAAVPAGFADRLDAVERTLPRRSSGIASVVLFQDPEDLPPTWRRILQSLLHHGTDVEVRRLEPELTGDDDLSGARTPGFTPRGDGSLQLLRPYGPLQAAEEVAAWLAAQHGLDDVLVIGANPVLDAAFHRHGLPTVGAASPRPDHLLFRVLPLVLDLGWHPADPQRALELLTLPLNPVPARMGRRLIRALSEWPAVDSDVWREQLARGLDDFEDEDSRLQAKRHIEGIFRPVVSYGGRYPAGQVRDRAGIVRDWLIAGAASTEDDTAPWRSAADCCSMVIRLLDDTGQDDFTAPQLERLLELAALDVPSDRPFPAQAGLAAVGGPGAVTGGARRIIWWDFALGSVPAIPTLPFSAGEIEALARLHVHLPDRGREAEILARRWRRPLLAARSTLLLVCPHQGEEGEELFPHPLWHEICANLESRELVVRLERSVPSSRTDVPLRPPRLDPLPAFRRLWQIAPDSIERREKESPSSTGTLIGCSFKWVGEYAGRLRPGLSQAIAGESRVLGSLAHAVLAELLSEDDVSRPARAEKRAAEIFDREAPRLMAALYLPGADARLAMARRTICRAAVVLCSHLTRHGRQVLAVESPRSRPALGTVFEGRPDLLVGPSPAVIDLKWSGSRYYRDSLARGTAYQLASYSHLAAEGAGPPPPVAYFILRDQKLISTDPEAFPGAERVGGSAPAEVWKAFERAHAAAWERLQTGEVEATWPLAEKGEDAVVDGLLTLEPPCRFCDLAVVCGAALTEES